MNTNREVFVASKLTLAVRGALMVLLAMPLTSYAEDEEVAALTHPTSSAEIGAEYVSRDSAKFGEYNGLNKKGADLIGNFNVRGGDAYNSHDGGDGTHRWEFKGADLGTTSRAVSGNLSNQGKWSFGIGYDELRHNTADTYQTPYLGSMGGNNFSLPANFGVISTTAKPTIPPGSPYSAGVAPGTAFLTAPGSNVLTAAQLAAFNTKDVYNDRDNASFNAKYLFDTHWDVKFDYNHLVQSGAKLMGVADDQINGVSTIALEPAGQTPVVIMNPTNYTTDTFNLGLNWKDDRAHVSASYYGSMFRDGYNSVSFDNPFQKAAPGTAGISPNLQDTMSTMPSNDFHQLNLIGGYDFTSATKLAGGLSYGRNTQNDTYSNSGLMAVGGLPQNSLNGLVVTTHADMKLTNQTTKDLLLSAGLKYNERDNQTASNSYTFYTINESPLNTAAPALPGISVNAPMSNRKTQLELAGDYRIDKDQKLRLSYEHEQIKRWCDNAAANNMQGTTNVAYNGPWTYSVATCAQVPNSKEDKLAANYKLKVSDDVNFSAGYGYSDRKADISPSFYNPMQALGGGANGEGFEVAGFVAYFDASRKEQLLKSGVNWQASEKLSVALNGRYTDDKYDSTYGVQKGDSWSLNLDSTYSYSENSSLSAYVTSQNSSRDMNNLQGAVITTANATRLNVPVGATWTNKLKENDTTLGLGSKLAGLMDKKLVLTGDLTYSLGKSSYGTQFNYAAATNPGGLTCSSPQFETCGNLPDIKNTMVQLRLAGSYKIDKASRVIAQYVYQHLKSSDYFYNAYQYGSTPSSLLPTNQQAPSYTVNAVGIAYVLEF